MKLTPSGLPASLKSEKLVIIILVAITFPTIIHTKSLLLKITQVDGPDWLIHLYAWFFAIAFDCSIFMFAIYERKKQAIAFAIMSGLIGWMFWNSDLVFAAWWQPEANRPELASRLLMGTLISAFMAYLVYYCSELTAERLRAKGSLRPRGSGSQRNPPNPPKADRLPKMENPIHPPLKAQEANRVSPDRVSPDRVSPDRVSPDRVAGRERVIRMLEDGEKVSAIVEQTGVGRSTVYEYKKQLAL